MNDIIRLFLRRDVACVLVFLGMLLGLCMSIGFQWFGSYTPCTLCLIQRCLLAGISIVLAMALSFRKKPDIYEIFFIVTSIGLLLASGVACYQLLIQYGYVPEPSFCAKNNALYEQSVDALLEQIENTSSGGCKALGPTIFGLPISAYSCAGTFCSFVYLILSRKD